MLKWQITCGRIYRSIKEITKLNQKIILDFLYKKYDENITLSPKLVEEDIILFF